MGIKRRASFVDQSVTYGAVGGTRAEDLLRYPPEGYRPAEQQVRLGSGRKRFDAASRALLTWGVQRGSGVEVTGTENASAIVNGMTAVLVQPSWPKPLTVPVRVVYVLEEENEVGFAYGTLPGAPICGEYSFAVELRDDHSVWLIIRSFVRRSENCSRLKSPLLRLHRARLAKRHLAALLPGRAAA